MAHGCGKSKAKLIRAAPVWATEKAQTAVNTCVEIRSKIRPLLSDVNRQNSIKARPARVSPCKA
jgi:hypothetical protein